MSATEIPVRMEIRLAMSAKPIQIQAMNQTLLSIMTPSFCRSHQLKCGSSSAQERQTPLPDANASCSIWDAQARCAVVLQKLFEPRADQAPKRYPIPGSVLIKEELVGFGSIFCRRCVT